MARVGDIVSVTGKVIEIKWGSEDDDYEATLQLDDKRTVTVPERFLRTQVTAKAIWPSENKAVKGPAEDK